MESHWSSFGKARAYLRATQAVSKEYTLGVKKDRGWELQSDPHKDDSHCIFAKRVLRNT